MEITVDSMKMPMDLLHKFLRQCFSDRPIIMVILIKCCANYTSISQKLSSFRLITWNVENKANPFELKVVIKR